MPASCQVFTERSVISSPFKPHYEPSRNYGASPDRYGCYVTKDFADYHVPVHADSPDIQVAFVNKPDFHVNALGTKGIGEIATIGVASVIANAVFNATGKRIRELPITPDKLV